jgi:hypothetical protein
LGCLELIKKSKDDLDADQIQPNLISQPPDFAEPGKLVPA